MYDIKTNTQTTLHKAIIAQISTVFDCESNVGYPFLFDGLIVANVRHFYRRTCACIRVLQMVCKTEIKSLCLKFRFRMQKGCNSLSHHNILTTKI